MNFGPNVTPLRPPLNLQPPQQSTYQSVPIPVSMANRVPVYSCQPYAPTMSNAYAKSSVEN